MGKGGKRSKQSDAQNEEYGYNNSNYSMNNGGYSSQYGTPPNSYNHQQQHLQQPMQRRHVAAQPQFGNQSQNLFHHSQDNNNAAFFFQFVNVSFVLFDSF